MPRQPDVKGIPDDESCWKAVLDRDRRFDGIFVYAVRTTGIFCRPSCPARRPKRENASFLAPEDAVGAGYRPCRRCRPLSAGGTTAERAVRRALSFLEAHLDEHVSLERLGAEADMSPFHLQRTFKDRIGLSPREWQEARRLERFRKSSREGHGVGRATWEAGFSSSRGLYEAAEGLGMTPGRYSRAGQGLQIRYTVVDSYLGRVLVAATETGICAVFLGEDDEGLEADLREEFAAARLKRDDEGLAPRARAVVRQARGEDPGLAVPVDLRGTVFQLRVWQALRDIPPGETRSYGQVSEAVGRPGAARAVGAACAANRAALLVPCHRVVRADGTPGGYRWGPGRKRLLLDRERDEGT